MRFKHLFTTAALTLFTAQPQPSEANFPIVINTWGFLDACSTAYDALTVTPTSASAVDAVEIGCTRCEELQCDGSVGFGSHPDENGEVTLDSMIMDGETFNVGSVAALRRVKNAAGVARKVLDNTHHSMLAGELATQFAVQMGFKEESLNTDKSQNQFEEWKNNTCQPNFWTVIN